MIRTNGGCCDCGSPSAWKKTGFCKYHRGTCEEDDPSSFLPATFRPIVTNVIFAVVKLLADSLRSVDASSTESQSSSSSPSTAGEVRQIATIIQWLTMVCGCGDAVRSVVGTCLVAHGGIQSQDFCLLASLMRLDNALSDRLRAQVHGLYYQLIRDPRTKKAFLFWFVHFYSIFIANHLRQAEQGLFRLEDGPDLPNEFSVQLFTSAPYTEPMVTQLHLLDMLIDTLRTVIAKTLQVDGQTGVAIITMTHPIIRYRMYWRITTDLLFVLTHERCARYMMHERPNVLSSFLRVVGLLQGMNENIRETGDHVEYENNSWVAAFTIEMDVMRALPRLTVALRPPTANARVGRWTPTALPWQLCSTLQEHAQKVVAQVTEALSLSELFNHPGPGGSASTSQSRSSSKGTSMHIPLHRILGLFLYEILKGWNASLETIFSKCALPPEFFGRLVENPLSIQVLLAQVKAGMWVRNGRSVWGQTLLYRSTHCHDHFLDLDLFILQVCAVMIGTDRFIQVAIDRFGLAPVFLTGYLAVSKESLMMAESFVHFIITVSCDRTRSGGSEYDLIRRDMIHRLCIRDHTHSQLAKSMCRRLVYHPLFERVLGEIADYIEPTRMEPGKYRLKPECWNEYSPYYVYYSVKDLEDADQRYRERCKTSNTGSPLWLPDHLACGALFGALMPLPELLLSVPLWRMMLSILRLSQGASSPPPQLAASTAPSDALLTSICHLLIIALKFAASRGVCRDSSLDKEMVEALVGMRSNPDVHVSQECIALLLRLLVSSNPELATAAEAGPHPSHHEALWKERARARQHEILARFRLQQQAFEEEHKREFDEQRVAGDAPRSSGALVPRCDSQAVLTKLVESSRRRMSSGCIVTVPDTEPMANDAVRWCCVLCHEESSANPARPLGILMLAQRSRLLAVAKRRALRTADAHCKCELQTASPSPPRSPADVHSAAAMAWVQYDDEDQGDEAQHFMLNIMYRGEPADDMTAHASADTRLLIRNDDDDDVPAVAPTATPTEADATAAGADWLPGTPLQNRLSAQHEPQGMEPDSRGGPESADNDDMTDHPRAAQRRRLSTRRHSSGDAEDDMEEDSLRPSPADSAAPATDLADSDNVLTSLPANDSTIHVDNSPMSMDLMEESAAMSILELEEDAQGDFGSSSGHADDKQWLVPDVQLYRDVSDSCSVLVQTCGHRVHADCLDRYFSSLLQKHMEQDEYEGEDVANLHVGEFLCPVCRRLCNGLVPLPSLATPPLQRAWSEECSDAKHKDSEFENVEQWFRHTGQRLRSYHCRKLASPTAHHENPVIMTTGRRSCVAESPQVPDASDSQTLFGANAHAHRSLFRDALDACAMRIVITSTQVGHESLVMDVRVTPYLWNTVAATISASEIKMRSVKDIASIRTVRDDIFFLGTLVRAVALHTGAFHGLPILHEALSQMWRVMEGESGVLTPEFPLVSEDSTEPQPPSTPHTFPPLLSMDLFGVLVRLTLGSTDPPTAPYFLMLVRALYLAHVAQVVLHLLAHQDPAVRPLMRAPRPVHFCQDVTSFATLVYFLTNALHGSLQSPSCLPPSGRRLSFSQGNIPSLVAHAAPVGAAVAAVKDLCTPFLRRCRLLQHALFDGDDTRPPLISLDGDADALLAALRLRAPDTLFSDEVVDTTPALVGQLSLPQSTLYFRRHMLGAWVKQWSLVHSHAAGLDLPPSPPPPAPSQFESRLSPRRPEQQPRPRTRGKGAPAVVPELPRCVPFRLVALPASYQDLLLQHEYRACLNCNKVPQQGALCLLCGAIICVASSCCRNLVGECTSHSEACGGGIAIVLVLRLTYVLLLRHGRHCFWGSPYLDEFGEEDFGMGRGRPLYLNDTRYEDLTRLYVCSAIDHEPRVLDVSTRHDSMLL